MPVYCWFARYSATAVASSPSMMFGGIAPCPFSIIERISSCDKRDPTSFKAGRLPWPSKFSPWHEIQFCWMTASASTVVVSVSISVSPPVSAGSSGDVSSDWDCASFCSPRYGAGSGSCMNKRLTTLMMCSAQVLRTLLWSNLYATTVNA